MLDDGRVTLMQSCPAGAVLGDELASVRITASRVAEVVAFALDLALDEAAVFEGEVFEGEDLEAEPDGEPVPELDCVGEPVLELVAEGVLEALLVDEEDALPVDDGVLDEPVPAFEEPVPALEEPVPEPEELAPEPEGAEEDVEDEGELDVGGGEELGGELLAGGVGEVDA
jgi:hypothetical protein